MARIRNALARWVDGCAYRWDLLGGSEEFPDVFAPGTSVAAPQVTRQDRRRPVCHITYEPLGPRTLPDPDPEALARVVAQYDEALIQLLTERAA